MSRKLLVIDTSYAYEAILARKLEDSVTCRDLGGFFEHVWTVHPFASLVTEGKTTSTGVPAVHALSDVHTFIDGKVGRFEALARAPLANFLASQADLLASLSSLIRRERISAIRAGDPLYNGLLGLLLARSTSIPLLVRVNANLDKMNAATGRATMPRLFRSYRVEKAVMRLVLSQADLVAAVNQDNLDFAIANGARSEFSTIFRYGNLIDKRHISPPELRDTSASILNEFGSGAFRFLLCIGRLEDIKRPDDVVRVLAELRSRGHELKAILVGDGTMRSALGELAQSLSVSDHVIFAGNRDQEWLSRVIPQAAAVVSPITGRALSEAAFGAAPIAAYDLDWQGELIRTGETGELSPGGSWRAMADGVERLITDAAYARHVGQAARARAFEMLDPATLDEHERQSYRALFARHARR